MKEILALMSFSTLLFVSSGLLSQPSDDKKVSPTEYTSKAQTAESSLVIAKTDLTTHQPRLETDNTDALKVAPAPSDAVSVPVSIDSNILPDDSQLREQFSDEQLAQFRKLFLLAEEKLKKNNDASYFLLADQLKEYPLYPYLQYQWLNKHLGAKRQIIHFLEQHGGSRYSGKLKYRWLHHLAKNKQWPLFLQYYKPTNDTTLNCYYHRAQYDTGAKQTALEGAVKLWSVGKSQPHACDALFAHLKKSALFTQELRWQRFDAALQNNKTSLAAYVRNLMPQQYHKTAQLWLQLHRNPARYLPQFLNTATTPQSGMMFRHAIDRLASNDITKAIDIWDKNKKRYSLDNQTTEKPAMDKLERRLAFKLAYERDPAAYDRLDQLNIHDDSSRAWRVRTALAEQNWHNVLSAIDELSESEKQQEKWQYWTARANLEIGETEKARDQLTELSSKRSFYGYLAADRVDNLYQLVDNPISVSSEELIALKNRSEFRVAFELMVLDRKNEAKLQWWHATKSLNKDEIIIASKLAQKWQWDEIAIFTVAKAKYWDDIEMRFPLSYADNIHENSVKQNLNPALIFGLVRRESAFNENAHSPAGARGLMQIMPRTGRQIARHFNERWRGGKSLYNPVTNIKYGSYYYQKLLNQFDGHYAIALAAYNAGPERVKTWLPENEELPADIWIETIPYQETRNYVAAVLAYALIYQQRTQSDGLSMQDFTPHVMPRASGNKI